MDARDSAGGPGSALGAIVTATATPYGYTVSLWSAGAILIRSHSFPTLAEVFLFAAGAMAGYTVVGLLGRHRLDATAPAALGAQRVLAGALHWFAVGLAVGAVALVAQIPGSIAWPLGSFAATTLYLFGAAIELALVVKRP